MVGKPEVNVDLLYATGFQAPDDVVYLQRHRRRVLVVSELEYGRAVRTCSGLKVYTPKQLGLDWPQARSVVNWAVALLRKEKCRTCVMPEWTAVGIKRGLEREGVGVEIGAGNILRRRSCKSEEEIEQIRLAQQAAVKAMRMAAAMIKASEPRRDGVLSLNRRILTSEWVRSEIEKALLEHQCATPGGTLVAGGVQAVDPHEAGQGPLLARQPIVIDIFPRLKTSGYWGDLSRTYIKGTPTVELQRMYSAVRRAQSEALKLVRPRMQGSTIHARVCEVFESSGFRTERVDGKPTGFIHSTGHGVGLDIHEDPRLSRSAGRLRKGQVITVEPGLYYPKLGGIRIEDTVVVTATGYERLASMSRQWRL